MRKERLPNKSWKDITTEFEVSRTFKNDKGSTMTLIEDMGLDFFSREQYNANRKLVGIKTGKPPKNVSSLNSAGGEHIIIQWGRKKK